MQSMKKERGWRRAPRSSNICVSFVSCHFAPQPGNGEQRAQHQTLSSVDLPAPLAPNTPMRLVNST
jgi:hypothetical protein